MSKPEFDCMIHREDLDEIYNCISCVRERIAADERERILQEIEKLRPFTDDKQKVYFAPFELIIAAIKGENK